jgi:hypothetical protein
LVVQASLMNGVGEGDGLGVSTAVAVAVAGRSEGVAAIDAVAAEEEELGEFDPHARQTHTMHARRKAYRRRMFDLGPLE